MTYTFGEFTLDVDARRLCRRGADLHTSPKAFDLLRLLVEQGPRAVPKSEIHAHLWGATHVTDMSVAALISEIRRILQDPADDPLFIRTVPRFGYAFCADASTPIGAEGPVRVWLVSALARIPLADGVYVLGRGADVDVPLAFGDVSRHHARVVVDGDSVTLEDLGSTNRTFVDGFCVTSPTSLVDGSEVTIGSVTLTLRARAGSDAQTQAKGASEAG